MKQLKVLAEFRDKNDFTLRHEAGDMLFIDDEKRVALLVQLGLCEVVGEVKRVESGESKVESELSDPVEETDTADTEAPAETEEQPEEPSEETVQQSSEEETEAKPKAPKGRKSAAKETAKKPVTRKKKSA